ncbi:MAG: glutathione S-transferase C-terminal domain-containing protein [Porticoccus sp.]|nr:glutathione S-transferase C-terminal domain-containing protein [Porticoccus sp.]
MNTNELCHVTTTSFHNTLGSAKYPFESGRYWLFTSKLCPFAHRTELARKLTGLDRHIGLTIAGSVQTEKGWNLVDIYTGDGNSPSPVAQIGRLPGIYALASPGYTGRASVPVLFDTKTQTIVNNESAEIIQMFDSVAVEIADHHTLYPKSQRTGIDEIIRSMNDDLISPIYRAGFARNQADYDTNFNKVFTALSKLDSYLAHTGPFIAGEALTLADVHAYPHLSRFDAIYHSLYRLNKNFISDHTNIAAYLSRLGAISIIADTLDLQASKNGYFLSWNQPTNANFVPSGPVVDPRSGVAVVGVRLAR